MISPHVVTVMFNQDVQYTWDADFLGLINAGPLPSTLFYGDFVLHSVIQTMLLQTAGLLNCL